MMCNFVLDRRFKLKVGDPVHQRKSGKVYPLRFKDKRLNKSRIVYSGNGKLFFVNDCTCKECRRRFA